MQALQLGQRELHFLVWIARHLEHMDATTVERIALGLRAAGERTGVKIGADEGRFGSGEQRAGAMRQPLRIFERAQLARGVDQDIAVGADPEAAAFYETLSAQNRFALTFRTLSLKTEAGRRKRIAGFVEMLRNGETIYPQGRS